MNALCVLFDSSCAFCCQCVKWLAQQDQSVKVWCLPRGSRQAIDAFGAAVNSGEGAEAQLVVIDSDGGVYRGSDAFIMCLWALEKYSNWAARFASPRLRPHARSMFELISGKRHLLSTLWPTQSDEQLASRLSAIAEPPRCDEGGCKVPPSPTDYARR